MPWQRLKVGKWAQTDIPAALSLTTEAGHESATFLVGSKINTHRRVAVFFRLLYVVTMITSPPADVNWLTGDSSPRFRTFCFWRTHYALGGTDCPRSVLLFTRVARFRHTRIALRNRLFACEQGVFRHACFLSFRLRRRHLLTTRRRDFSLRASRS